MRVISRQELVLFCRQHPSAERPLSAWFAAANAAKWKTPQDIKAAFASASFVGSNRVVFNIKSNDFRLVVAVAHVMAVPGTSSSSAHTKSTTASTSQPSSLSDEHDPIPDSPHLQPS